MKIYDNGGKTYDQYCVVFHDGTALFMSSNPTHPQGVCMHGENTAGPHLGEEIEFKDLPEACQIVIEKEQME
jgi:hypothetical protein